MVQKVSLLLLMGCLYFLGVMMFSDRGLPKYHKLSEQMEAVKKKRATLTESIKQHQENIHQAEDLAHIEEQARLQYGLVKKDEKVYWLSEAH